MSEFTTRLLNWYYENKRELPFRDSSNPYKIWVSEIMAQQTQIATMIPYYQRWIKRFPDVRTLAEAEIDDVLKLWEGLGYYRRARNLHKGAQYLCEHHDGKLPATKAELMQVPGIGDYTSSAIASIAFGQPEIAIDGNVKRVMARYLNYTENANTRLAHKTFETFLKQELMESQASPSDFTQALMELGALVYTPSNTQCAGSPFKEMCACYRGENVGTIPYFPPKKKVPEYEKAVWIYIENEHILLSKDASDGLMDGLLRLPQTDQHEALPVLATLVHKYSHLHWNLEAYTMTTYDFSNDQWFLVPLAALNEVAMITAHKKLLQKLDIIKK